MEARPCAAPAPPDPGLTVNPEWLSFLIGMVAGVGLVIAVWGFWRLWRDRQSRRRPEIASEAERWLQDQRGGKQEGRDR
jgi:hypothetical protein